MQLGFMTVEEGRKSDWQALFDELVNDRRATVLQTQSVSRRETHRLKSVRTDLWVAAERLNQLRAVYPDASLNPQIEPPASYANETWTPCEALVEILRGRLDGLGPSPSPSSRIRFRCRRTKSNRRWRRLEGEGFAMQGQFTPGGTQASAPAEERARSARGRARYRQSGVRVVCSREFTATR